MIISVSLAGALGTLTQLDLNERRVQSANMIWGTVSAAVGVCPGYDDFLVWLDFQNDPATAVPMTAEAVEDFSRSVLPLIERHKELHYKIELESEAAQVKWLLNTCNRVREEGFPEGDLREGMSAWESLPSYEPCRDAYHEVVAALGEFLTRHHTIPDPGTALS